MRYLLVTLGVLALVFSGCMATPAEETETVDPESQYPDPVTINTGNEMTQSVTVDEGSSLEQSVTVVE